MSYPTAPDTVRLRSRPIVGSVQSGSKIVLEEHRVRLEQGQHQDPQAAGRRWLEFVEEEPLVSLSSRIAVRTFDLVVSIVGLIILAPIMAAVALAVKLDSPGPILYGSPRIGQNGLFTAWKFRSMHLDAEAHLARLLETDVEARREYQRFHKLRKDPRLTMVGSFIRRTSLDELPQLINILAGQMSVVGPRPKLVNDAEVFGPALEVVLRVKPGLTGLWQVSGRNRLPVRDRVALDIDYARNRSFRGDLDICAKTFLQLWRPGKHGAY